MAIEFNDRRNKFSSSSNPECEVCWAGRKGYNEQASLYSYGGSTYCKNDLDRAMNEGWHPGSSKVKQIK